MASGTLGQAAPSATTNTVVYTVAGTSLASMNVNILNRGSTAVSVRLAIAASSTPTDQEYLEYDFSIPANGILERTGLLATTGKMVVVYASNANTSVNVYGYEE